MKHAPRLSLNVLRSTLLVLVSAATLGTARAASVVISPVTMEISPQTQTSAMTTLINQGTTPLEFSASLVRWTQQNGADVNVPTHDAAVNPAHFILAPGHRQVVRIGLRGHPSQPQVTYRLLLRQEAQPASAQASGTTTVQAAINPTYVFSLPLFVTQNGAKPQVHATLERTAGGLTLTLNNTGTAHASFKNITATVNGESVNLGSVYVLAGSTMHVPVPALPAGLRTLVIHSNDNDQQDHTETLDVPAQ